MSRGYFNCLIATAAIGAALCVLSSQTFAQSAQCNPKTSSTCTVHTRDHRPAQQVKTVVSTGLMVGSQVVVVNKMTPRSKPGPKFDPAAVIEAARQAKRSAENAAKSASEAKTGQELSERARDDAGRARDAANEAKKAAEGFAEKAAEANRAADAAKQAAESASQKAKTSEDNAANHARAAEDSARKAETARLAAVRIEEDVKRIKTDTEQLVADAKSLLAKAKAKMALIVKARNDLRTERALGLEMLFRRGVDDLLQADVRQSPNRAVAVEFDRKPYLRDLFPEIWGWFVENRGSQWEVDNRSPKLLSYGTQNWKGRTLVMGFYKVDIDLRNAPQGQYRKNCFVVSFLRDEEFRVLRDPWSSGCDNSEAQIKKRMEQTGFRELWKRE